MIRSISAGELIKLRRDNQFVETYLAVDVPTIIFQARVNESFGSYDDITSITYDDVIYGDYTDIKQEMTLLIGTDAKASDIGIARIRKTPTADTLYVGRMSNVKVQSDQFLTVIDTIELFARHLHVTEEAIYMDEDITYSDQHTKCDPVPVLGPPAAAWINEDSGEIDVIFDASDSWVIGSTISSFVWDAPGSSAVAGGTTVAPTITYDTPGVYTVSCNVTASSGKSTIGYRKVFIYSEASPPVTQFQVDACEGSRATGGWSFEITLYDEATQIEIRDRSLVVLFARDYFAESPFNIGQIEGRENLIMVGNIAGETIEPDPDTGTVSFMVHGPHFWLNKVTGFPAGIEDTDFADNAGGEPNRWTEFNQLNLDHYLWHVLHWRSNATVQMDIMLTGNTVNTATLESPVEFLWQQMTQVSLQRAFAFPACDKYGRLFVEVDPQMVDLASRNFIVIMDVQKGDWMKLDIERKTEGELGAIDLTGIAYLDGEATPICVRSPGTIFARYGSAQRVDQVSLIDLPHALSLAGLYFSKMNNEYPMIVIEMPMNNRMFDICPREIVTMSLTGPDNERGLVWAEKELFPTGVKLNISTEEGLVSTSLICEAATDEVAPAIEIDCAEFPEDIPGPDPIPIPDPEPIPDPDPDPDPDPVYLANAWVCVRNSTHPSREGVYFSEDFNITGSMPHWNHIYVESPTRFCVDESDPSHAYVMANYLTPSTTQGIYHISQGGGASLILDNASAYALVSGMLGACEGQGILGPWVDKTDGRVYAGYSGANRYGCKSFILRSSRGGGGFSVIGKGAAISGGIRGTLCAYKTKAWSGAVMSLMGNSGVVLNDNGRMYLDIYWPSRKTYQLGGSGGHSVYPDQHEEDYCWTWGQGQGGKTSALYRVKDVGTIELEKEEKYPGRCVIPGGMGNFWVHPDAAGHCRTLNGGIMLTTNNHFDTVSEWVVKLGGNHFTIMSNLCQMRWSTYYDWGAGWAYGWGYGTTSPAIYAWNYDLECVARQGTNWNSDPFTDAIPTGSNPVYHGFWAGVANEFGEPEE